MATKRSIIGVSIVVLFMAAMVAQSQEAITNYLYSTDIGSDLDMSDPNTSGTREFMDAGAIYTPRGKEPLLWKDDDDMTKSWSGYPFVKTTQPAPGDIGNSATDAYSKFFDLDAEDQVLNKEAVQTGQPSGPSPLKALEQAGIYSIYNSVRLSYDDDGARGWAVSADVPTLSGLDRAIEIYGTTLSLSLSGSSSTPLHDEESLLLAPNPGGEPFDDDVDALDWHPLVDDPKGEGAFLSRYFSPDHEANLKLDPGSIYRTERNGGQNFVLAFDDEEHFGLLEETDVDAFEFVAIDHAWGVLLGLEMKPKDWTTAAIFSVDEDDPDTFGIDESGGLNPNIIYLTNLEGDYVPVSKDYENDIDALTVIPEPVALALIGVLGGGMLFIRRFFLM